MKHPEKKQVQIIVIAAAIIVGFTVLRFYPLARRMARIRQTRVEQVAAVAQVRQYTLSIPALRRQAADLRVELVDYDRRIPGDRQFADLYHQMAEAMNRYNLKDQIVQPGGETTGQTVGCIPITIQCSGTLEQTFGFLKSLADFDRLIRIEELQLQNDAEYSGQIKLNAAAKVYYQAAFEASI